jgi:hypothetical protein
MTNTIKGQADQLIFRNTRTKVSFSSKIWKLETLLWKGVIIVIIWMVFWFLTSQNFPIFMSEEYLQSYFIPQIFYRFESEYSIIRGPRMTCLAINDSNNQCVHQASYHTLLWRRSILNLHSMQTNERLMKLSLMMIERKILQDIENSPNLHWLCSRYFHWKELLHRTHAEV